MSQEPGRPTAPGITRLPLPVKGEAQRTATCTPDPQPAESAEQSAPDRHSPSPSPAFVPPPPADDPPDSSSGDVVAASPPDRPPFVAPSEAGSPCVADRTPPVASRPATPPGLQPTSTQATAHDPRPAPNHRRRAPPLYEPSLVLISSLHTANPVPSTSVPSTTDGRPASFSLEPGPGSISVTYPAQLVSFWHIPAQPSWSAKGMPWTLCSRMWIRACSPQRSDRWSGLPWRIGVVR